MHLRRVLTSRRHLLELEVLPLVAPNQSKVCCTVCKTNFVRIQKIKMQAHIISSHAGLLAPGGKASAPSADKS